MGYQPRRHVAVGSYAVPPQVGSGLVRLPPYDPRLANPIGPGPRYCLRCEWVHPPEKPCDPARAGALKPPPTPCYSTCKRCGEMHYRPPHGACDPEKLSRIQTVETPTRFRPLRWLFSLFVIRDEFPKRSH